MQKLLIIAPQNPYPAIDGGKISIYYPLIHLAKYFHIHFVFPYTNPLPAGIEAQFASLKIKIYPQKLNTNDSITGVMVNIFSKLPYKFQKYCRKSVLENLSKIVKDEKISYIWCNHSHLAWYAIKLKEEFDVKIFLREHNIEYALVRQAVDLYKATLVSLYIRYQYRKTKKYEVSCWKLFDKIFFISDSDLSEAREAWHGDGKFKLLYDGFYSEKPFVKKTKEPSSFIFTGNLKSLQNGYNLKCFVEQIWLPLIAKDSRWKLYITGNEDGLIRAKVIADFEGHNIINLGFVEDIASEITGKKYFISPTYIGSGIRIKVLNAMSTGAVCFLSPLDGRMIFHFKDLHNIVQFKDFKEFESKLVKLESDGPLYQRISTNAAELSSFFNWADYAKEVQNEISIFEEKN